ncbi:family 20 glycosylhydrolase [Microbacterium sp. SSW1-59]|uniref:family 20 glycosylhydrolase n=1 Tax=Microbacterium xanthum TaxID=3079794 RepID=UPI002AD3DF66|nr:family 20 glycosylhydrolase [Microbacterium sp. SSW1-59]MDZ8201466.1 family 20 glycosylhydrolase [Microbacterium sp. SSW1-59]
MTLPLVPHPTSVREHDAPAFRVGDRVGITGDDAATEVLRRGLARVAGATAERGEGIRLEIVPGRPAESYAIEAGSRGVLVTGADPAGLFYAAHTLVQLLRRDDTGWHVPAVSIADGPRFAYRGVMLDVARHFFDVDTVCAWIDRAAALKMNHLHLHLSDDQGWRIALPSRPELAARASQTAIGHDRGGHYTAADYRRIVTHAAQRHMTVVPEIDMPGHTHAVGLAYPELVAEPVITDDVRTAVETFGGGLPRTGTPYQGLAVGFSSLRIAEPATDRFVTDVFTDLAALTPGPYLHLGGDEALGTDPALFASFVARATEVITALGKTPVAWHEAGAAEALAPGTVGQYWGLATPADGMDDKARRFVTGGGSLILSPADAVYLDMKPEPDFPLGLTWANGHTSVRRAYEWEPADVIDGIAETDILGVEAPLWTETVRTAEDIDALAFPRVAAAAEAAWSPAMRDSPERTWESFRSRVGAQGPRWRAEGIRYHASEEIPWV